MRVVFPGIWDAEQVFGMDVVLAHQGGWDEALMVFVPICLFVGLLWLATVRSHHEHGPTEDHREGP